MAKPAAEKAKEETQHKVAIAITNDLDVKDASNQVIRKVEAEYEGKENVIIENLDGCEVYLPFKIKCLYVKNVKACKIFVGCVSGASFVNQAVDS